MQKLNINNFLPIISQERSKLTNFKKCIFNKVELNFLRIKPRLYREKHKRSRLLIYQNEFNKLKKTLSIFFLSKNKIRLFVKIVIQKSMHNRLFLTNLLQKQKNISTPTKQMGVYFFDNNVSTFFEILHNQHDYLKKTNLFIDEPNKMRTLDSIKNFK